MSVFWFMSGWEVKLSVKFLRLFRVVCDRNDVVRGCYKFLCGYLV